MVRIETLNFLARQSRKDASVLFHKLRHNAAIYLMGYSLEFALKSKIVSTLGFTEGFPETPSEFRHYEEQITLFNAIGTGIQITQLREIKNHNLKSLLTFSGAEARIINSFYDNWIIVQKWNPENRYKIRRQSHFKAKLFITSAKIILENIH